MAELHDIDEIVPYQCHIESTGEIVEAVFPEDQWVVWRNVALGSVCLVVGLALGIFCGRLVWKIGTPSPGEAGLVLILFGCSVFFALGVGGGTVLLVRGLVPRRILFDPRTGVCRMRRLRLWTLSRRASELASIRITLTSPGSNPRGSLNVVIRGRKPWLILDAPTECQTKKHVLTYFTSVAETVADLLSLPVTVEHTEQPSPADDPKVNDSSRVINPDENTSGVEVIEERITFEIALWMVLAILIPLGFCSLSLLDHLGDVLGLVCGIPLGGLLFCLILAYLTRTSTTTILVNHQTGICRYRHFPGFERMSPITQVSTIQIVLLPNHPFINGRLQLAIEGESAWSIQQTRRLCESTDDVLVLLQPTADRLADVLDKPVRVILDS